MRMMKTGRMEIKPFQKMEKSPDVKLDVKPIDRRPPLQTLYPDETLKHSGAVKTSVNTSTIAHPLRPSSEMVALVKEAMDPTRGSRLDALGALLASKEISDDDLAFAYTYMLENKHQLQSKSKCLVDMLLRSTWSTRSSFVAVAFANLVRSLLFSNVWAIKDVLKTLVGVFVLKKAQCVAVQTGIEEFNRRKQWDSIFANTHLVVDSIFTQIPGAKHHLVPILEKSFPYKKAPPFAQECFVLNLLKMIEYCPELRPKILQILFQHFVALDVLAARIDIMELDFGDSLSVTAAKGSSKFMREIKSSPAPLCLASFSSSSTMNHQIARTLDSLMTVILEWLTRQWFASRTVVKKEESSNSGFNVLWRELLSIFHKTILPCEKTNHLPFIMFYLCSLSQAITEAFLDYLWKRVIDSTQPVVIRRAAACYVASFIARAKFCKEMILRTVLTLMLNWAIRYCERLQMKDDEPCCNDHSVFYVVSQSIFYIVAFRHKELFFENQMAHRQYSLQLEQLVNSMLNPLNYCMEGVVNNFANACSMYQVIDCHPIINKNRRGQIPTFKVRMDDKQFRMGDDDDEEDVEESEERKMNPLGTFFPFEAYLLTESGPYINGNDSWMDFQGFNSKCPGNHLDSCGEDVVDDEFELCVQKKDVDVDEEYDELMDDDSMEARRLSEMILDI